MEHNKGANAKNYDLIKCNIFSFLSSPLFLYNNGKYDVPCSIPFHVPILYIIFCSSLLLYIFSFHSTRRKNDIRVDSYGENVFELKTEQTANFLKWIF